MNKLFSSKSTTGYNGIIFYGKRKYMVSVFATVRNDQGVLYSTTISLGYRDNLTDALILRIAALEFINLNTKMKVRQMLRGELRDAIIKYSEENKDYLMPLALKAMEERDKENQKLGINKEAAKESITDSTVKAEEIHQHQNLLSIKTFKVKIASIFLMHHNRQNKNYVSDVVAGVLRSYADKAAKEEYYPHADLKKSIIKTFIIPDCEGGVVEDTPVAFIPASLAYNIIPEWMIAVINAYILGLTRSGVSLPFVSLSIDEAKSRGELDVLLNFFGPILSFKKLQDATDPIVKCNVVFTKDKCNNSIKILESLTRENNIFKTKLFDLDGDLSNFIFDTFVMNYTENYTSNFKFFNEASIGFENLTPLLKQCDIE